MGTSAALFFGRGRGYHDRVLGHRLISSCVMIAVLAVLFYFDDRLDRVDLSGTLFQRFLLGRSHAPAGLLMWVTFTALIALAAGEIRDIFHTKGVAVDRTLLVVGAAGGCAWVYGIPGLPDSQVAVAIGASGLILLVAVSLAVHGRHRCVAGATAVASATVFGAVYLGLAPGFFLAIRRSSSPWMVAAVIAVIKMCDVGAYGVGRVVGRHKLVPWLSPGKTWEGLVGGLAASAGTCWVLAVLANQYQGVSSWIGQTGRVGVDGPHAYPLWYALVSGAVIGLVGQLGDLAASFFKRDAGIKDSGRALPGFGGVLDVLDSLIVAAPVAYWLLQLEAIIP